MEPTIKLANRGEWWIATDETTGITGRGRTREAALESLDAALDDADKEMAFEAIGVYPDPAADDETG